MLLLFLSSIYLKNIKNLCVFMRNKLENSFFKHHRAYYLFFYRILILFIYHNFSLLKMKGFYLSFRGKMNKGGDSRKQILTFRKGTTSLGNKHLAMQSHN